MCVTEKNVLSVLAAYRVCSSTTTERTMTIKQTIPLCRFTYGMEGGREGVKRRGVSSQVVLALRCVICFTSRVGQERATTTHTHFICHITYIPNLNDTSRGRLPSYYPTQLSQVSFEGLMHSHCPGIDISVCSLLCNSS